MSPKEIVVTNGSSLFVSDIIEFENLKINSEGPNQSFNSSVIDVVIKWYSPKNIEDLDETFKKKALSRNEKKHFLDSVKSRHKSEYILIVSQLDYQYKNQRQSFVKIYKYINERAVESKVISISREENTIIYKDEIDVYGLKNIFWKMEPYALDFLFGFDQRILKDQEEKVKKDLLNLKSRLSNNSSSVNITEYYELENSLKYSVDESENNLYKVLFVQPKDSVRSKALSEHQKLEIKERFPELNDKELKKLEEFLSKSLVIESVKVIQQSIKLDTKEGIKVVRDIIALGFKE